MSSKIFITFILMISFLKVINLDLCSEGKNNVENKNECFTNSTSDSYCCFKSEDKKCYLIKKKKLAEYYEYDCGISDENYGKYEFREYHPNQTFDIGFQTCGEINPKDKETCIKYSELTNSCCFFTKELTGDKACFAIGRKFNIEIYKGEYEIEGEKYTYNCKSFNIILSLYSFLLIALNLL